MKTISSKGIDLIVSFEKEILRVYDDGFGYPTLGVGHLLTSAEKAAMPIGTKITREQSREYFRKDLSKYILAVNNAINVPINQNQFDACVSLCFNIGVGGFNRSSVVRKINAKDYNGAANAFLAWNKAKGKVVKGLVRRRNAERDLFLSKVSAALAPSITSDTPLQDANTATEVTSEPPTTTTTTETNTGASIVSTTVGNQQDVNENVTIEGAKAYNEIGLAGTLKNDAKGLLPANVGFQSISEWIQQSTGWPPWITALLPRLALILVICTALWILYRIGAWAMWHWRDNERVKLEAMVNSDINRKNITIQ